MDLHVTHSAAPVIDEETLTRIRKMEREAVQLADSNESLMEALDILQQVLTICPQYASALNNRAQVYRILGRSQEAMEDLNKAIELAYDYDVLGKVSRLGYALTTVN